MAERKTEHCGLPRSLWRCLRFIEHVATGALILLVASLISRPGERPAWVPDAVQWWYRRMARALDLRVEVTGTIASQCLLVSNHVSWLDVIVLGSQGHVGFLSKSEVRAWPLIGWMASVFESTLFIERGAHQVGTVMAEIGARLARGAPLVIFPEGTTTDGAGVARFYPPLFAIAMQPDLGVQPVAISYRSGEQPPPDLRIAYTGNQTLIANLWRVLRHPGLVARVQFLAPLRPEPDEGRRTLSARTRSAILSALGLPESAGASRPPRPRPHPGRAA